jgi:hypothetical protein
MQCKLVQDVSYFVQTSVDAVVPTNAMRISHQPPVLLGFETDYWSRISIYLKPLQTRTVFHVLPALYGASEKDHYPDSIVAGQFRVLEDFLEGLATSQARSMTCLGFVD